MDVINDNVQGSFPSKCDYNAFVACRRMQEWSEKRAFEARILIHG